MTVPRAQVTARRGCVPAMLVAALLATTSGLAAQERGPERAETVGRPVEILPLEEETRLALSAAPDHLRDGAGVVALTADGFVAARESTNGYTCVVNRDHPLNRKPTCYDAEGTATILPRVRLVGELLLLGVELRAIERRVEAKFERGEFISPRRPGVAYMLSSEIRSYDAQTGEVGTFPPHLMFYAPDLTNDEIGTSWEALREDRWLPFVGYEGPHGFLIVVAPDAARTADPDAAVEAGHAAPEVGADSVEVRRVLESYYAALSERDWPRYEDHFWDGAMLTTTWTPPGETTDRVAATSVPEFVARAPEGPGSREIFEERMISFQIEVLGAVAQARVRYKARFGDPGDVEEWEGIDAFTLLRHEGRWKITSLAYAADG